MDSLCRTAHDGTALRFVLEGPAGPVELKVTPAWAALTVAGEAECLPGDEIAALWRAADCDDAVIWAELERGYPEWTAPPEPTGPAAEPRYAELRAAAAWVGVAEEVGSEADARQAEAEHMAALRRLIANTDT